MLAHDLLLRNRVDFDIQGIGHVGVIVPSEVGRWIPEPWAEVGFGGTAPEDADGGIVA